MSFTDLKPGYWQEVTDRLKELVSAEIYESWFKQLSPQEETQNSLTLSTKDSFAAIWIQDNYVQLIQETIEELTQNSVLVTIEYISDQPKVLSQIKRTPKIAGSAMVNSQETIRKLNPDYTFSNFVTGPSNQAAQLACLTAAHNPGTYANPICLHGETGLGKTHLLHAHAHEAYKLHPNLRILYRTTEQFIDDFVQATQQRTLPRFRNFYRNTDILLIDDVHFLGRNPTMQEEFFRLFNDIHTHGKQILLTSDRPLSLIPHLEATLIARFQSGLTPAITRPDYDTRLKILQTKALQLQVQLEPQVTNFLAESIQANIRRLEGALNCLGHLQKLKGKQSVDLPLAKQILGDILREEHEDHNSIPPEEIQRQVAHRFHLKISDLLGPRRPNKIAVPRQIAMYLCRNLTNLSLKEIGQIFGGRDHGTVIHACNTVETRMELEKAFLESVRALQEELSQPGFSLQRKD
jgi:chromosomal replication initiator protein